MTKALTRAERRAGRRSRVQWYRVRRWAYWVTAAALAVLVFYRVIDPAALPVILPLVLAALNTNPPPLPGEDTTP